MSLEESNADIKMLGSFFELGHNCMKAVTAKESLYNYASTKGNCISEIVALLFQIPRRSMEITESTVEQMIAEINNRSMKSVTMTEAWIALQPFNQPTAIELSDLFNELSSCINEALIVDLIKLICEYLSANVQRIFLGMQLYILDTAENWEIGEIKRILWMSHQGEYFVYVKYDGWHNKWNEWLPVNSPRLKWMKTKQGELMATAPTVSPQAGECYDFLNYRTAEWVSVRVIEANTSSFSFYDIVINDETDGNGNALMRRAYGKKAFALHRTFTGCASKLRQQSYLVKVALTTPMLDLYQMSK